MTLRHASVFVRQARGWNRHWRPAAVLTVAAILTWGCGSGGATPGIEGDTIPPPDGGGTTGGVLKISVARDGIYKLTYDALWTAGFNVVGISPNDLKLTSFIDGRETEIPLRVSDGGDGQLNSGDFLEFYGTGIPRGDRRFEFTETNVYWLRGEAGARKRIPQKSLPIDTASVEETSFPDLLHVEEDTHYWQNMPDEDLLDGLKPDRWMWGDYLVSGEARDGLYTFNIPNYDKNFPVTVKFRFQSRSVAPDHRVKVYLNFPDNLIADETWGGLASHEFTVDVTAKRLLDGTNSLRIENAGDNQLSQFYLVWFEVSYRDTLKSDDKSRLVFNGNGDGVGAGVRLFRLKNFTSSPDVYDVTDNPTTVTRIAPSASFGGVYQFQDLSGRRYLAATDAGKMAPTLVLDDPVDLKGAGGADEIVITHEGFSDAVLPLAQFRESQGLKVVTAKIGDIYDAFSGGVEDPLAIREFLRYAYQNWTPRPRYVLLVGDASYDYKDHLGYGGTIGVRNYVPTHLYEYEGLGEVPSDNWFGDLVTDDGVGLPEMAVGRIPAKTATQATQVVNKILYYEKFGNPKPYAEDLWYLFVADNNDDPTVSVSPFETLSLNLSNQAPVPETTNSRLLFLGNGYRNDLSAFRIDLLAALNEGPLLVNYVGHGAVIDWGKEGLFRSEAFPDPVTGETIPGVTGAADYSMTNRGKYPFVVSLDCLNGNFALPDEGTLDVDGTRIPVSLAEAFLMANEKGAVAVWAASALQYPSDYEVLGQRLFDKIFVENRRVLGDAVMGAMTGSSSDVIFPMDVFSTFVFFGDPATRLAIP